jgi:hypothetical protein
MRNEKRDGTVKDKIGNEEFKIQQPKSRLRTLWLGKWGPGYCQLWIYAFIALLILFILLLIIVVRF